MNLGPSAHEKMKKISAIIGDMHEIIIIIIIIAIFIAVIRRVE